MRRLKTPLTTKTAEGFTFIELSLAILFVSLLALTVALVTSNISKIYSKGLAIKAVNSTGSNLIEELSVTINQAPATQLTAVCETVFPYDHVNVGSHYNKCRDDTAYKFVFSEIRQRVRLKDEIPSAFTVQNLQTSGVFCTGKYSYIWNTGYVNNDLYALDASDDPVRAATVKYRYRSGSDIITKEDDKFRLLRIEDPSRVACASRLMDYGTDVEGSVYRNTKYTTSTSLTYDLTHTSITTSDYVLPSAPVELLPPTENALSLYGFYVASPSQDSTTNRLLYSGSFVLATIRGGVKITNTHDYCDIENGFDDDFDYCAINKFNFAAQATGSGK